MQNSIKEFIQSDLNYPSLFISWLKWLGYCLVAALTNYTTCALCRSTWTARSTLTRIHHSESCSSRCPPGSVVPMSRLDFPR